MADSLPLRWLYLDLNSYFASVEQQMNPALRGRPVVVAPVMTDSTSAIAASYEAKAYGIRTGTKIWQAKAMCRDVVIVPGRHDDYVRFHHKVIDEVNRHVPVTNICSIDEVACRLMDNENSPAAVAALATAIKAGLNANVGECLTASIGLASNRLLAKMAADMYRAVGLASCEEACSVIDSEVVTRVTMGCATSSLPSAPPTSFEFVLASAALRVSKKLPILCSRIFRAPSAKIST